MSIYVLNLSSHAHVSTAGQVHAFHLSFKIFFLSLFCFFFLLPSSTKKNRAKHGSAPSLSHLGNKVWVKKCVFSITLYFFFLYIHGSHKYLYVHLKSNNLLDQTPTVTAWRQKWEESNHCKESLSLLSIMHCTVISFFFQFSHTNNI